MSKLISALFKDTGTGTLGDGTEEIKYINFPFGKFDITIKLTKNNEFIGISELKISRDFLAKKKKLPAKFFDVEKYYKDED